jgi:hypothetical protein
MRLADPRGGNGMTRRRFTAAPVLSLLVCIAVAALWVRSYWVVDYGGHYVNHYDAAGCHLTACGALSERGGIRLFWFRRLATPTMMDEWFVLRNPEADEWNHLRDEPRQYPRATDMPGWYVAGFGFYHGDHTPPIPQMISNDIYVLFPDWLVILATAGIFAAWCRGTVVRRCRISQGRCLSCGYDLRASKGRCPECGSPIPTNTSA